MAEERAKPIFTFKGLSYLYHIEQCRLRPVGFDRQGIKYFELVDLVENKQFFTAEVADLEEDIVIKDKYGVIRFCVHGWGVMAQLDVYVNIRKPIGVVKDGVFYDHNLIPIFLVRRSNLGAFNCFGPPTYKVSTVLNTEDVGYITPEPSSMHLKFDQLLDEGPKALLVSYAIQLALGKFKFLNLNLGKVRYLYKNRDQIKEEKAAQRVEDQKRKSTVAQPVGMPFLPMIMSAAEKVPSLVQSQAPRLSQPQDSGERRKSSIGSDARPQVFVINVPEQKPAPQAPPQVIVVPQQSQDQPEKMPELPPPPTVPQAPRDSVTGESPDLVLVKVTKQKRRVSSSSHRRHSNASHRRLSRASHRPSNASHRLSRVVAPFPLVAEQNGDKSHHHVDITRHSSQLLPEGVLSALDLNDPDRFKLQHQRQNFSDIPQTDYPRTTRPSRTFPADNPKTTVSPTRIASKLSNLSATQSKMTKLKNQSSNRVSPLANSAMAKIKSSQRVSPDH